MKRSIHKSLVWLMTVSMVIMLLPMAAFASYSDSEGHWAQAAIDKWSDVGVLKGWNGEFRPDDSITRGEMAVVIDRVMNYKAKAGNSFSDLGQAFYTDAILKANAAGVINGYGSTVCPTNNITREEAVVMLGRAFGLAEQSTCSKTYSDSSDVSSWAAGYVNAMTDTGYVQGSDGKFYPKASITRAEAITIIDNAIKALFSQAKEYTQDVTGMAIVNTPDVVLKDMQINGNLIISEGVGDGDVTLDNVTVTGKIIVRGGGENSIHIQGNSNIANIIIEKTDDGKVRVVTEDGAVVEAVFVDDGNDDVILTGSFENVTVAANVNIKAVGANIKKVNVTAKNGSVDVDKDTQISELNVADTAEGTKINNNGNIQKANIDANGITLDGNKPVTVDVDDSVTEKPTDSAGNEVSSGSDTPSGGGSYVPTPAETAKFVPVNSFGIHAEKVYAGYKLQDEDDKQIALIKSNIASMRVKNPDGTTTNLTVGDDTDPLLWMNVEKAEGDYVYTVVTKAGVTYKATLNLVAPKTATWDATDEEGDHDNVTYVEYNLIDAELEGDQVVSLHEDDVKLIASKDTDDKWVELTPNTDSTLWFNKTKAAGNYDFIVVTDANVIYKATLNYASTVTRSDSTGGEGTIYNEETRTFSGTIDYYEADDSLGRTAGNRVGVKITAPAAVKVDPTKATFTYTNSSGEVTLVNGVEGQKWMDGKDYVLYYPLVTKAPDTFTVVIDWDGDGKYAPETITISIADDTNLEEAPPIEANFESTGSVGIAPDTAGEDVAGNIYAEYKLVAETGDISLAESNIGEEGYIKVKIGDGDWEELTSNTDATLWFNIEAATGERSYKVKTKDGKVYTATLDWEEEIKDATWKATAREGTRPDTKDTYVEFKLMDGTNQVSLKKDVAKLFASKEADGKWKSHELNTDATFWVKKDTASGSYEYFIVAKDNVLYKATLDYKK